MEGTAEKIDARKDASFDRLKDVYVTPSDALEYLFCPRFIYFMYCLCIPQHQELRYKVQKGREVHDKKARMNTHYLRRRIGCVGKETNVYLSSEKYRLKGEVDEVLFLDDGTYAPLDYKFAQYKGRIYRTLKYQSVLYALLIMDNYRKDVKRGYICFVRSNNLLKEIVFEKEDFEFAMKMVDDILSIIHRNRYPKKTAFSAQCVDCCYRRICV